MRGGKERERERDMHVVSLSLKSTSLALQYHCSRSLKASTQSLPTSHMKHFTHPLTNHIIKVNGHSRSDRTKRERETSITHLQTSGMCVAMEREREREREPDWSTSTAIREHSSEIAHWYRITAVIDRFVLTDN